MIELTNDGKLQKDGLSKDLSLADVLTEEEEQIMVAKLRKAGKYSIKGEILQSRRRT